ncbi:hypothetical protein EXIGLDRAFT_835986 [Exidia glandulosa HHB12029]|uniref:Uncharacterized protein n=1 Tax=Exidia glandulosa HHB12029 TaxID=1314781 RepID=A0A165I9G9_EXIGL|nr:hypothetical protein EXIGLDRAFT_835986 [Exidia glandulosa HHB12029]
MDQPSTEDAGLKLLTSPPVFDSLYAFCSPGDLCCVAKTCNGASQAVTNYLTHSVTIDLSRLLLRFFTSQEEILDFRRLQAKHQFLISGSAALQLLDRTTYPNSDLDLYLFPHDAEVVGRWLIEHGYTFSPYRRGKKTFEEALEAMPLPRTELDNDELHERTPYGLPGVRAVLNFKKVTKRDLGLLPVTSSPGAPRYHFAEAKTAEIQLIIADVTPYEAILKFHTTVVMNIITWDRAIALFPLGTLEQRRGIVTHNASWSFDRCVDKYADRGFSFLKPLARFKEDFERGPFRFGPRFFGDEHSWVVKLDTTGIEPPEIPVAVEGNSWELEWDDAYDCFALRAERLDWSMVHHKYCISDSFLAYIIALYESFNKPENAGQYTQFFDSDPDLRLAKLSSDDKASYNSGKDVQVLSLLLRHFRDAREADLLAERLKHL